MRHTTALACVVAAVASAGDPAAAQISHLGQHISDHVVLRDGAVSGRAEPDCPSTASFNNKALFRVWPDGTQASVPFTVPAARQLVITDVEWNVDALSSGFPLIPGDTVRTRLRIGSGTTFTPVFLSRTVEVGAESSPVAGTEQSTAGVVVASNTLICPSASAVSSGVVRSARLLELVLRGYLINTQ